MNRVLPISFVNEGLPYKGIIESSNENNTVFNLHLNNHRVAIICYKSGWTMDGRFTKMTGFIEHYIDQYF